MQNDDQVPINFIKKYARARSFL